MATERTSAGTASPGLDHSGVLRLLAEKLRPTAYLRAAKEYADIDNLLASVIEELALGVRIELANKIAESSPGFKQTARELARHQIDVARPVLELSEALSEEDLLEVIAEQSQHHLMAVTKRQHISERVSDALVVHGDDNVVVSLLENARAQINYETFEKITTRAQDAPLLQGPLIGRSNVPLDLLNELYFKVESHLRREILSRYANIPTHDLSIALLQSRRRWLVRHAGLPKDYEAARTEVDELQKSGKLKPPLLVWLLRDRKHTAFKFALARLTETDYDLVNRILERRDFGALAIVARAGRFDRALFVTLALLITGRDQFTADAEEFGRLYDSVSTEVAYKAVCLWKTGLMDE